MPTKDTAMQVPQELVSRLMDFLDTAQGQRVEVKPEVPWREEMDDFLEAYSECGHVGIAAELVEVPRTTLYNWRRNNAEFGAKWTEIKERFGRNPDKDRLLIEYVKKLRSQLKRHRGDLDTCGST